MGILDESYDDDGDEYEGEPLQLGPFNLLKIIIKTNTIEDDLLLMTMILSLMRVEARLTDSLLKLRILFIRPSKENHQADNIEDDEHKTSKP